MSNKKKIIISLFLIIILIAPIIFYIYSEKSSTSETRKYKQNRSAIPIPLIPNDTEEQNYEIEFNVNEKDFVFPREMSLIKTEPEEISESYLSIIAKKLNFESEPKVTEDYFDGKIISYVNNEGYLTSSVKTGEIEYSLQNIPNTSISITEEEIIRRATSFLSTSNLTNTDENFVSGVSYYNKTSVDNELAPTKNKNADVYQINFTSNISKFPILTETPETPLTYVRLIKNGVVISANTTRLKSIETSETRDIKSYQEVKDALSEAVIVSMSDGVMFLEQAPENAIEKISVNNISLAYYKSNRSTIIQPVFLLKGSASIYTIDEDIPIVLYLPAIK